MTEINKRLSIVMLGLAIGGVLSLLWIDWRHVAVVLIVEVVTIGCAALCLGEIR